VLTPIANPNCRQRISTGHKSATACVIRLSRNEGHRNWRRRYQQHTANAVFRLLRWASWVLPGLLRASDADGRSGNIHGLSHEIAEWADDRRQTTLGRALADPNAPQYGCSGLLRRDGCRNWVSRWVFNTFRARTGIPTAHKAADGYYHPEMRCSFACYMRLAPEIRCPSSTKRLVRMSAPSHDGRPQFRSLDSDAGQRVLAANSDRKPARWWQVRGRLSCPAVAFGCLERSAASGAAVSMEMVPYQVSSLGRMSIHVTLIHRSRLRVMRK